MSTTPVSPEAQKAYDRAKIQLMRIPNTLFYSTILFSLKTVWVPESSPITTAATNGTHLFLNQKFILELNDKQRIGLLVHEMLHVALDHMTRLGPRNPRIWNVAADHVINLTIMDAGSYELPPGALCDGRFKGMSSEQVYKIVFDETTDLDQVNIPGGFDVLSPDPNKPADVAKIQNDVANIVAKAQMSAAAAGQMPGQLPGELEVHLDSVLNPKLPWNVILQNYMTSFAKDDYTWRTPNRRYYPEFYLPSTFSEALGTIASAVDFSGSVSDTEASYFIAEHAQMQEYMKPDMIKLIAFDTKIRSIHDISQDTDIFKDLKFTGRGGTDVREILNWAIENNPMVMLIFTDGEFNMPTEDFHPTCPIVWLIHDNPNFTAPFGEVIHYDMGQ